ncbi:MULTISPECIES: hypothetical protein [unclassified Devosia]|uniref:hypothetical protein n=1 Tax=unclassified Devosia TaxID=196773 RepID=UPI001551A9CF|nr:MULTISPECIES: hypothetical protein [unclassified Devosia]
MSHQFDGRSIVLRVEYSIADAVQQRGLVPVLIAALRAYWSRPRLPPDLPAYLREDVGLSPPIQPMHWLDVQINPHGRRGAPPPPL